MSGGPGEVNAERQGTGRARRYLRWTGWLLVPTVVGVFAWRHRAEVLDALRLLPSAHRGWLVLGLLAVALLYLCRAMVYRVPLVALGYEFPRHFLWKTAVIASALQQAFPSAGLSAYAFLTWALHRRGVPRGQAPLIALIDTLSYAVTTATLVVVSVVILARARLLPSTVLGPAIVPGLVLLAFGAWVYVLQRDERRFVPRVLALGRRLATLVAAPFPEPAVRRFLEEYYRGKRLIRRRPGRFLGMMAWQYAAVGCDAAILYCALAALGIHLAPWLVLLGFVVALTVGTVVTAPGGGGSLEMLLSVFFVAQGVDTAPALAATLVFRLESFWAPLLVGAVLLPSLRRATGEIRPARAVRSEPA